MIKLKELKSWVNGFQLVNDAMEELLVLQEFLNEGEADEADLSKAFKVAQRRIEDLELRNMLQKEEDRMGAILKIRCWCWWY